MISRPSILTTLAAAVLALLPLGAPARASQSPRPIDTRAVGRLAPLPGSMLPHLDAARRLSPLPADTELPLTIG
ncbi:MAG: hypothetical protein JOZ41_05700, partial [Chloroflexi bacterium]|nr:hypothetical protein [Chloroflexota bacterium]